jgi:FixJ family two-component response regulator
MNVQHCERERQTLDAIRGCKAGVETASARAGIPGMLGNPARKSLLGRLKLHDWQLLCQAYVSGANHEKIALAMGLQSESVRRRRSHMRNKLAMLIRDRLQPRDWEAGK